MALPPAPIQSRPFLAPMFLRSATGAADNALLTLLVAEITALVAPGGGTRAITHQSPQSVSGGLRSVTIEYRMTTEPAWAPPGRYIDVTHHLLVISAKGPLTAICSSETSMRTRIGKRLTAARPIARSEVETAFVGDETKALWLNGIHTRSDVKPNAKTLMGDALEFAIDPLGDQTYAFNAVRSKVPLALSGGGNGAMIGAAPAEGRVWLNRPADWSAFVADVETLLDIVAASPPAVVRFPALAQHVTDLSGVSRAYAVAFVPSELLSEDTEAPVREEAARWAYETDFQVTSGPGATLTCDVTLASVPLGQLSIVPVLVDRRVSLTVTWIAQRPAAAAKCEELDRILAFYDWLKIYYESGHTIAEGSCYLSSYSSQWFPGWKFRDLAGYDVDREKPAVLAGLDLAQSIGELKADGQRDNSLFGYCFDQFGAGWLASDDGSMELADFVHIAQNGEVTLIHAKAASSARPNRETSASAYEVVTGQAVKNLRHLHRRTLADVLQAGQHHLIGGAVWLNGQRQPNRNGLIQHARALPLNHSRRVVILQPQLTQREHDLCQAGQATGTRITKMKQLNTLLLSARQSANAVGAELEVWAAA